MSGKRPHGPGASPAPAWRHVLAALLLAAAWPVATQAAAPAAGTVIDSQASATFVDAASGQTSTIQSNLVRVIVQPVPALALTDAGNLRRAPGTQATWSWQLTNTGNVDSQVLLTLANEAGDDFDMSQLRIVVDLNHNGVADGGEPSVTQVSLREGQTLDLLVVGRLPGSASTGSQARLLLRAAIASSTVQVQDQVGVQATGGPVIDLTQTVLPAIAVRNQNLELDLIATNVGEDAEGGWVNVDGAPVRRVLLRYSIPAGTRYVAAEHSQLAELLFHLAGTPPRDFVDTPPADLSRVDAIALSFDSFAQGTSTRLRLWVNVRTFTGTITSIATFNIADDAAGTTTSDTWSNQVSVRVVGSASSLNYYTDNSYNHVEGVAYVGDSLHIRANSAACNADGQLAETITVRIVSRETGDAEGYPALETGPNTGIFDVQQAIPTQEVDDHPAAADGIVQTHRNDHLVATIQGCGTDASPVEILVDPYGIVFDSRTNQAVAGATVELIDVAGSGNGGNAGGAARVFGLDGTTPAPSSLISDAEGGYRFPLVAPSTYRLRVTPPAGYGFPSRIEAGRLPAGRTIDLPGSYGGNFQVAADSPPVHIDLPVDAVPASGLLVQKTATRDVAEIGDVVDYRVRINNTSGVTLPDVMLADGLPRGFTYQPGTARRDGAPLADPVGTPRSGLRFTVGALPDTTTTLLTYRVRIEATAGLGDTISQAQASADTPVLRRSNLAQHKLRVEGGVFSDRGFLLGKVWADCNGDGMQQPGEPGVPAVRVWMEDGTYAVTDGAGKYSFYGVAPVTHVAKLDPATLPAGSRTLAWDARQAGDGDSRFVDMKNGELMRGDFALAGCSDALKDEIERRRRKLDGPAVPQGVSAERLPDAAAAPLSLDVPPADDLRSRSAAGIVLPAQPATSAFSTALQMPFTGATAGSGASGISGSPMAAVLPGTPGVGNRTAADLAAAAGGPAAARPGSALEQLASKGAPTDRITEPAFLEPRDGEVIANRQTRLRTVSLLGSQLSVLVNGEPLTDSRLGSRVERADQQTEWREYIGIELQPGANRLTLEQRDAGGNLRASTGITVQASGELQRVMVEAEAQAAGNASAADAGGTRVIVVRLEDAKGLPVTSRTPLTLSSDLGTWMVPDLDPGEAGTQVFVEGGEARFVLAASDHPGTAHVSASVGVLRGQADVPFTATLREMVAAGVIEGVFDLRRLRSGALRPARAGDGFEQELMALAHEGDVRVGGRAALFLKGKVRGDYLLTLGYDSAKSSRTDLFRDIQPDRFYPVYGDASVKGYDAQSTGKLYVRIDRNRSWLLLGDYTTSPVSSASGVQARRIGVYNRSLNGVRHHYESDRLTVDSFASRDSSRQVVEELPGNGTSGPYLLANQDLKANSELVEILTRDRNQSDVILRRQPQSRFADYEVEPYTGRLLFKAPVPSLDADLNPVSIRVTYEVDQGGRSFWVAGADAQYKVSDSLSVGAIAVQDRNPQDPGSLRGLNMSWKLGSATTVTAEAARSSQASVGEGWAQRVEVVHDDGKLQVRAYAGRADAGFGNAGSALARGNQEAAAKMSYTLDERTRLVGEAIRTAQSITGEQRAGAMVGVERSLGGNVKAEVGLRHTQGRSASVATLPGQSLDDRQDAEETSVRARLSGPVPGVADATVFGEYEQAMGDAAHRMAALGGEYRLSDNGRLYGRYEFISSLSGPYDLAGNDRRNTAIVGLDRTLGENTRGFSEYRARDAFDGREAEAAMGLRNQWQVAEGVRLNTSFERVKALAGGSDTRERNESTAVTGAVELTTSPGWKASGRLEYRTASGSDSILASAGLALKLDEEWTALARGIVNIVQARLATSDDERASFRLQQRTQLGLAWRDLQTSVWSALGRYEWKTDRDSTPGADYARQVHVVSAHLNARISRPLTLSGRYAAKLARDRSLGLSSVTFTQLLGARALYDLDERWDLGLQAGGLFTRDGAWQAGLGSEVGYRLQTNLWVSAGYNLQGFRDTDLAGDDHTERGVYLRLRFKFDEKLLGDSP